MNIEKNKKGFTLIELLAVLVILAILALISIPITIRIINQARENSYKRSIANYGNAVETAIGEYLLRNPSVEYNSIFTDHLQDLNIDVSNDNVTCDFNKSIIDENGKLVLKKCVANGDKQKYRYFDRKVTKEYEYDIGDEVIIKGEKYYVIEDSPDNKNYVVALKAEPLTIQEVNKYGAGHMYRIGPVAVNEAYDIMYRDYENGGNKSTGYGGMQLYASSSCTIDENRNTIFSGCISDYADSDVRYTVDAWATDKFKNNELKEVNSYKARLIHVSELINNLQCKPDCQSSPYDFTNNNNYSYWTMDKLSTSWPGTYWNIVFRGGENTATVVTHMYNYDMAIRPVINIDKDKIK